MKHGWRLIFIPLWVLCIAGAAVTVFLALGWVGWKAFAVAVVIGAVTGIPAGLWNTHKVRRDDPAWS